MVRRCGVEGRSAADRAACRLLKRACLDVQGPGSDCALHVSRKEVCTSQAQRLGGKQWRWWARQGSTSSRAAQGSRHAGAEQAGGTRRMGEACRRPRPPVYSLNSRLRSSRLTTFSKQICLPLHLSAQVSGLTLRAAGGQA